ncbi:MAG: polyprenyl synthetase family protein [Thiovulaceae bacterium]|nr:polyprenyl synthetase family protein [Sulfurimonadaceae bacterium]
MKAFENFLETHLPRLETIHPHFEKSLEIMMKSGGKRFRPALILAVVKAYEPLLVESSYHACLAVESLHTYSLIHDDLPAMDDASLRRGVETLHLTFDEVTAILAGDALNTYAFELLAKAPFSAQTRIDLVKSLSVNGGVSGMVIGQAVDCHFEDTLISLEALKTLHINKTAKLIAASLEMGAIIVNKKELQKELYDFGIDVGLLFQIQDDILDQTMSSIDAGKTTANDEGKNSFVNLLGLEKARSEADTLAQELQKRLLTFDATLQEELASLLTHYFNRHN